MAREPSVETIRAETNSPWPASSADALPGAPADAEAGAGDGDGGDYGFGRSRPLSPDEKHRLARKQGEAIASGRARKGHIVLNTPLRRAIFIGGLIGIAVLVLAVAILG